MSSTNTSPPEDIAAALVNTHRARLPEPEELVANTPEAREKAKADRHRPGVRDQPGQLEESSS